MSITRWTFSDFVLFGFCCVMVAVCFYLTPDAIDQCLYGANVPNP